MVWSLPFVHFAHAFHELHCIVRVNSAARFENKWPADSVNFENGNWTEYFVHSNR